MEILQTIFHTSRSQQRRTRRVESPLASPFRSETPDKRLRGRPQVKGGHQHGIDAGSSGEDLGTGVEEDEGDEEDVEEDDENGDRDDESEDEEEETTPLLPIFDSTHLDTLPVYTLTHTIRLLVISKCETVLSWEQLRSPQISQFLLKPIQSDIQSHHLCAATIYALMANCLQFSKEIATSPGNSGTSQTRALICELIAIKLLRDYNTRGLIDALSYDFDPLQGHADAVVTAQGNTQPSRQSTFKNLPKSVRISCLEIAIRAQAKRFLSHPLVVQQLEAVWDGSIVFHAAADSMHRKKPSYMVQQNYGTQVNKQSIGSGILPASGSRKLVTLYNPRDASLFKLSRLRVPRYRNILSTLSFAVLLGLFLAVLIERSLEISALEVVFWFWSAGYMLDEVVGFNEQGFGLYIASFWNTFDLGILVLLLVHLCLRVYGLAMPDDHKRAISNMAYDILAADAILLFPRLFSVLDHYRYFSQLIIAFRMMASDLAAVFILIVISCSGFFVALSLSFGEDNVDDPSSVAYALLQLLMGFTPAAWDRWNKYTVLGRAILTLFMFICHFLVVTILITVLTNSFMAVVRNANEEHQFLFAVNTISAVKTDSLFSFVAPLNVLQWLLFPLRFVLPFRQYVRINRIVIKMTHLPILFSIYAYEKTVLQSLVVDRIDMVEKRSRHRKTIVSRLPRLVREHSVATFKQDQALEEVFKQPFDATLRTAAGRQLRKSSTVVNKWMHDMGEDDASPPEEQDPQIVDQLERPVRRRNFSAYSRGRNFSRRTMSVNSDPEEHLSNADFISSRSRAISRGATDTIGTPDEGIERDDGDGDDELLSNDVEDDDDDKMTTDQMVEPRLRPPPSNNPFYLRSTPRTQPVGVDSGLRASSGMELEVDSRLSQPSAPFLSPPAVGDSRRRARPHFRTVSAATMIYNPPVETGTEDEPDSEARVPLGPRASKQPSGALSPFSKPSSSNTSRRIPKIREPPHARPTMPDKNNAAFRSAPNINPHSRLAEGAQQRKQSLEMDLVSDIGDNKAIGGGYVGAVPASIATQMALHTSGLRQEQAQRHEEQERISRLMMTRMNSLEEGFRSLIHEMRESNKTAQRELQGEAPVLQERRKARNKLTRSGFGGVTGSGGGSSTANNSADEPFRPPTAVLGSAVDGKPEDGSRYPDVNTDAQES